MLLTTSEVALGAGLIAVALGVFFAVLIAKTNARCRGVAVALLVGLFLTPLHMTAAGWMAALGAMGWATDALTALGFTEPLLSSIGGAIWVHAMAATPAATLLIAVSLRSVDATSEEQALLDSSPWRVLWNVTLPAAWPGMVAAACWTMVCASTEIAATDLFRVRTFAEETYTQAALGALVLPGASWGSSVLGYVSATLLLACLAYAVLTMLRRAVDRWIHTEQVRPWRARLGHGKWLATAALLAGLLLVAGVPLGSLVYQAGASPGYDSSAWSAGKLFEEVAIAPWEHRREILVSSSLAAVVATTTLMLASLLAWGMRASTRIAGGGWLVVALLLAAPGPLVGIMTIRALNQPPDGALSVLGDLYGTWFAPWLVQTVRVFPFAVIFLWPALASVPRSLVDSARSEGAGWLGCLLRVAVPMRWGAIGLTWVVAFSLSMGELSATALVTPPGTPPLSVRVLSLLHYGVEDRVAAICLVLFLAQTAAAAAALGIAWREERAT